MPLTDDCLKFEKSHLDGVQRMYEFSERFKVSLVNGAMLHCYSFAWEAGVMVDGCLCYDTPLTEDVEVFMTDDDAEAFIAKAKTYFATEDAAALPDNSRAREKLREDMARLSAEMRGENGG